MSFDIIVSDSVYLTVLTFFILKEKKKVLSY